jgi:hypothetical protein
MTQRELAQKSLEKILQYSRNVPPKERFRRMVAEGIINEEGEVLVTKEERKAGRPIEDGNANGTGTAGES